MPLKVLRVAVYARVSHDEQVKFGYSIDAQKEKLLNWVDENGHKLAGMYVDEGVSARKKVKNRKELQRLLLDIQNGDIDLIIFIKLDRYFRSVAEYHETQKILDAHGVNWKSITEDYDTTTSDGRFKVNMMLSFAEQEADRTSDRIKYTFEYKIKHKQPISGKQPRGYRIGNNADGTKCVEFDPEYVDVIPKIFAHFLKYQSVTGTVAYTNYDLGVKFGYKTISKMLLNPYYYGHYRGIDDYCPAYITKDMYDEIVRIRTKRNIKRPKSNRVYLFTGLLICPECKTKLTSTFTTTTGTEYYSYRCNNAYRHKRCGFKTTLTEIKLEKYILKQLKPALENYIANVEIVDDNKETTTERSEIIAEMERLSYMFRKNRIPVDEYDRDYERLEKRLVALDDTDDAQIDLDALQAFLNSDILDIYATLPRAEKRAALRSVIKRIEIKKDGKHAVIF